MADYQNKAIIILKKAHSKDMQQAEADRLAQEALVQKEDAEQQVLRAKEESVKFDNNVAQLQKNIQTIKANIGNWENELKTLKARVKVSNATKNLNKQMAELDSTGTVSMLERMKEKVAQEEALAEYRTIRVYKSQFRPMRYTLSDIQEKSMMKLIVDDASDRVVGLHMAGEESAEITQGFAVAVRMGATKADFDATVGIHPTSAEELVTLRDGETVSG